MERIGTDVKSWSERQTDRGRDGGFLEGDGERGWWGEHMDSSFICAGLLRGKWRNRPDFLFLMCSVSDVEPICLPGQNSKDPYLLHSFLSPLSSLQFSVFLSSFSVSQRLVENLL